MITREKYPPSFAHFPVDMRFCNKDICIQVVITRDMPLYKNYPL